MKFSLHSVHGGVKTIDEIHKRARRAEELKNERAFAFRRLHRFVPNSGQLRDDY